MDYFSTGLGILAILLLLSGIDDFIPLIICLKTLKREGKSFGDVESSGAIEQQIAVFVPCWHESKVIGNMVRHNLAAIRYRNFAFFLGVYPNDKETIREAAQLASEFPNVHVAECSRPGPTSKADCLNSIYGRMAAFEKERGSTFDTVVLHDAEDMIHPYAFNVINRAREHYEMVQVPVLPLRTGFSEVTHGVYCDEFAEYQTIDMQARQLSGSFVPSNGVGTGFAREVLARLARERNNLVFDPASLTEDYEIGVHIHEMGYQQIFWPLTWSSQGIIATREYFPRTVQTAIRQRTRWITGIALQCWERHGWRGSWRTRYWFWRDRKGLFTNPLSVLANLVFIAGVFDYLASLVFVRPWHFTVQSPAVAKLCAATLMIQWVRLALRSVCVGRIFGWRTAAAVPLRSFHANLINCCAAVRSVYTYVGAKRQKRALAWLKTEHAYPTRDSLHAHRRELADVLVGCGYLSEEQIAAARTQLDVGSSLDMLAFARRLVHEEQLCRAMSLQSGLPAARLDPANVRAHVVRGLPAHIEKEHGVVPFAIRDGTLLVATAVVPSRLTMDTVKEAAELPVEFQIVTQTAYDRLRELL